MRDTSPRLPALATRETLDALWRVAEPVAASALGALGVRWPALHEQHPRVPPGHAQGLLACAFELQQALCERAGAAALCLLPGGLESALLAALLVARVAAARAGPAGALQVHAPAQFAATLARLPSALQLHAVGAADVVAGTTPPTAATLRLHVAGTGHMRAAGGTGQGAPPDVYLHAVAPAPGAALALLGAHDDLLCLDLAALPGLAREAGPGLAALAATEALAPLLPVPLATCERGEYRWLYEDARPRTVGRLWADPPAARALLRAWVQLRLGTV